MHPNVHCSTIYNNQNMEVTKCPSTDEWIKKLWHIYIMEYYSGIKKWNYAICNIMDGPRDYAKWSKSKKNKHHMMSLICEI